MVTGHAYTVLGVETLTGGVKLVKMRNPWASEKYSAKWCDSCAEWADVSQADKDRIGFKKADDGIFYMPLDLFKSTFDYTDFTFDV